MKHLLLSACILILLAGFNIKAGLVPVPLITDRDIANISDAENIYTGSFVLRYESGNYVINFKPSICIKGETRDQITVTIGSAQWLAWNDLVVDKKVGNALLLTRRQAKSNDMELAHNYIGLLPLNDSKIASIKDNQLIGELLLNKLDESLDSSDLSKGAQHAIIEAFVLWKNKSPHFLKKLALLSKSDNADKTSRYEAINYRLLLDDYSVYDDINAILESNPQDAELVLYSLNTISNPGHLPYLKDIFIKGNADAKVQVLRCLDRLDSKDFDFFELYSIALKSGDERIVYHAIKHFAKIAQDPKYPVPSEISFQKKKVEYLNYFKSWINENVESYKK